MAKKIKTTEENLETEAPAKPENPPTQTGKKNIFDKKGELVIDVFETENEFVIVSAIAGVTIKDIDISIEKDMMIISGERKNPSSDDGKKYLYQECYWGPFSKKVILPEDIKTQEASAEIDKGILTIKFPKNIESKKEKSTIKIS